MGDILGEVRRWRAKADELRRIGCQTRSLGTFFWKWRTATTGSPITWRTKPVSARR
jgi:hypothetical protein